MRDASKRLGLSAEFVAASRATGASARGAVALQGRNRPSERARGRRGRRHAARRARSLCETCAVHQPLPPSLPHNTPKGPNLGGLFGRVSGTTPGFAYSNANKTKAIVWSEETLYDYLLVRFFLRVV